MSINTEVYGSPEQWINSSFQQAAITDKNKWAYFREEFPSFGLASGVAAGKLSYSEGIDKSLSYCGLGTECALSHIGYVTINNGTPELTDTQDRNITNFGFFGQPRNATIAQGNLFYINNIGQFSWENAATVTQDNYNGLLAPYTKIVPQNQVMLIVVNAMNNTSVISNIPLKDYLSTYKTTHPNIIQVKMIPYIGIIPDVGTRDTLGGVGYNQYFISFQLAIIDEFTIDSKNISFHAFDFWSMPIFGNFSSEYTLNTANALGIIAYTGNSYSHIKTIPSTGYPDRDKYYTEYYPEFEEDIMKTAACFGLYFTPDRQTALNGALTSNDMYIGILDSDGVGHGNYLRGANTAQAPQNSWNDMSDSGYDYTKDTDKTKYRNDTQFYDSALANGFTRFWVLGSSGVSQLLAELYNIMNEVDPDEPIERYSQQVFLTNNPIDCVISLKKFPLQNVPSLSGAYFVQLGSKTTSIQAFPLAKSCEVYYFTFSNATNTGLYPHFNKNFLDYEPYTTAKITIPFCGTVQVPATYFYDYGGVTVALVIDFISGACTGYIMANGITIDSVSGNCAITLPLSGIQSATLDSQIHSVAMAREKQQTTLGTGLIAGAVAIGVGIATGGVATAIGGAAAVIGSFMHAEDTGQQINYELSHMQTPLKQVAAASGQIAHAYDMRCKLLVTRPKILPGFGDEQQEAYANTIGFACLISSKVQDLHGFTVGTIDLEGVNCTAAEKEMIKNAFARGVYLK